MHPVLFTIGKFPVGTYGLFAALAVIAALGLARILARRSGLDEEGVMDLFVYSLLAGLFGSKLVILLLNFREAAAAPWRFVLHAARSFGSFYGGAAATVLVAALILVFKRLPLFRTLDVAALSCLLAAGMSGWGCFFAGCHYGKPTSLPWGMRFPAVPLCADGTRIHPWPLYAVATYLLIFALLYFVFSRKRFDGQVFVLGVFFFGATAFGLGFLRGDTTPLRALGGMVTADQLLALLAFVAAIPGYLLLRAKKPGTG